VAQQPGHRRRREPVPIAGLVSALLAACGPQSVAPREARQAPTRAAASASAKADLLAARRPPAWVVPSGESSEPTAAEWESATGFNTSTSPAREELCRFVPVREWVRFSCKYGAELRAWKWSSKSYKIRTDANGHEAFTARLRPGDLFAVGLYIDAVKVWARVAWPSSAAGPTVAEAWRSPEDLSVVHPAAPQAIPVTSQSSPVPPPLATGLTLCRSTPPRRRAVRRAAKPGCSRGGSDGDAVDGACTSAGSRASGTAASTTGRVSPALTSTGLFAS